MNNQECPCIECISLAICRHKVYARLFSDCSIMRRYIPNHSIESSRNPTLVKQLEKALNPTTWTYRMCPEFDIKHRMILDRHTLRPRVYNAL